MDLLPFEHLNMVPFVFYLGIYVPQAVIHSEGMRS